MKYSPKLTEQICSLLATGQHTISDVCKQVGITEETYHAWKRDKAKPEFSESIKKAEKQRLNQFQGMAMSGLAARLTVQEVEETTTEYVDKGGKRTIKSQKVTKRKVMPSDLLIMFTLKNTDPENFKDKQEVQHSGGLEFDYSKLSKAALAEFLNATKPE